MCDIEDMYDSDGNWIGAEKRGDCGHPESCGDAEKKAGSN
jgi:hypothetical protein